MYHVFLIDCANELDVPESNLYHLDVVWRELSPIAFFVGIYGLLPEKMDYGSLDSSCK